MKLPNDPDYQEKRANLRDKMIRLHRRNGLKVLRLRRGDKDLNEEEIKGKRQSEKAFSIVIFVSVYYMYTICLYSVLDT